MKKFTTITLCAMILSVIPFNAISAGICSVDDTVAGIGAQMECTGFSSQESLSVRVLPPLGAALTLHGTTDSQGKALLSVPAEETQVAGPYGAEVEGAGVRIDFTVLPESLDPRESSIEVDRTALTPDGVDEIRVTVILRDRYGNPLNARPVQLLSSRTEDRIRALTTQTDTEGQQMFAFTTNQAGKASLRTIDLLSGKPLDAQVTITAGDVISAYGGNADEGWYAPSSTSMEEDPWNRQGAEPVGEFQGRILYGQLNNSFDVVDHFLVEIESKTKDIPIRQDTTFRITAKDRNEKTVEDYTGSVRFSSTDPKAILPFGTRQFAAKDLGVKNFTLGLRFVTGGEQTLAVEDTSGNVRGSVTVQVTGGSVIPDSSKILIAEPTEGSMVNSANVIVKGTAQPLINLLITGGTEIARGDTNTEGAFQIPVTLNTQQTGATLQVEEATGKFKSSPIHLRIDLSGPRISAVEFSPREPSEDQITQITVKTEAGSAPVTMLLKDKSSPLQENPLEPGTFLGNFTAPSPSGDYQIMVTALDKIGNKSELLASLSVKQKTPGIVQNLTAEAKVNAVALQWEPVEKDTADTYRVYVGDREDNFAYSLDTDASVSAATVAGLKQATTYYFAVTALKDTIESPEKSKVASATVLGLRLSVIPGDTNLLMQWNSIKRTTPLSAYLLEYGVEPDQLTEKRMINGDADTYSLRDLLNGVTYFLQLTPISVTGELLKDLTTQAEGTPNGAGFHAVAGSGTQFAFDDLPLPPPPPTSVVEPGMPPATWMMLMAAAALLVFMLLHWQRRRSLRMTAAFLQGMQHQYNIR